MIDSNVFVTGLRPDGGASQAEHDRAEQTKRTDGKNQRDGTAIVDFRDGVA